MGTKKRRATKADKILQNVKMQKRMWTAHCRNDPISNKKTQHQRSETRSEGSLMADVNREDRNAARARYVDDVADRWADLELLRLILHVFKIC